MLLGIDMIVTYVKENFNSTIVQEMVVEALDFDPLPRGQFYATELKSLVGKN